MVSHALDALHAGNTPDDEQIIGGYIEHPPADPPEGVGKDLQRDVAAQLRVGRPIDLLVIYRHTGEPALRGCVPERAKGTPFGAGTVPHYGRRPPSGGPGGIG